MSAPVLLPVILCGGSGTRLWPLSRETYPKQFLALQGSQTMLQDTALRLRAPLEGAGVPAAPVVVCNTEHRFVAAEQLKAVGVQDAQILLEPVGRNTAPALTIATLQTAGDPVMLAMPADHVIADVAVFHAAVQRAFPLAAEGAMVAFGIQPDRAETGYGYMRCVPPGDDTALADADDRVQHILHFAEKPDAATAQAYVTSGDYLWNSGIFMVRASRWLHAMQHCRPDILQACRGAMQSAARDLDFIRPDASAFQACPSDSIDYAVMERLPRQPEIGIPSYAVPLHAGWSDMGAWDAVWSVLERDAAGNTAVGEAMLHECKDSLLFSTGRPIAAVGLDGMVVVETPDAILVTNKHRAQEVKHIVAGLKNAGPGLAQRHRKVHRPWGSYDVLDAGERFQVKRIMVNPGASLSLQIHRHRAEHWVVVKGVAEVTHGDRCFCLHENESTYIPLGQTHRLRNPGAEPLEIIEVQSGGYLGEDDIVRLDDAYGRVGPST